MLEGKSEAGHLNQTLTMVLCPNTPLFWDVNLCPPPWPTYMTVPNMTYRLLQDVFFHLLTFLDLIIIISLNVLHKKVDMI